MWQKLFHAVGAFLEAEGECEYADDYRHAEKYPYCPNQTCSYCAMARAFSKLGEGLPYAYDPRKVANTAKGEP